MSPGGWHSGLCARSKSGASWVRIQFMVDRFFTKRTWTMGLSNLNAYLASSAGDVKDGLARSPSHIILIVYSTDNVAGAIKMLQSVNINCDTRSVRLSPMTSFDRMGSFACSEKSVSTLIAFMEMLTSCANTVY